MISLNYSVPKCATHTLSKGIDGHPVGLTFVEYGGSKEILLDCKNVFLDFKDVEKFVAQGFFIEKDPVDYKTGTKVFLRKIKDSIRLGCFKISTADFMELYHEVKELQNKHFINSTKTDDEEVEHSSGVIHHDGGGNFGSPYSEGVQDGQEILF